MATFNHTVVRLSASGALVLAAGTLAHAGTVTARTSMTDIMVATVNSSLISGDVSTARMIWRRTDSPGAGIDDQTPGEFFAIGLEPDQGVTAERDYEFEHTTPMAAGWSAARMESMQVLWAQHIGAVIGGGAEEVFALHVAAWEILYDSDMSLDTGSFQVSSASPLAAAKTMAQQWLNDLPTGASWRPAMGILMHDDFQDQFFAEIPAPAPALVAGAGLLVVGRRRRSRRVDASMASDQRRIV